ncbi:hypothetical protein [Shewanella youngdeokensis]|uniref:Uncharacterized protein n=1 Tax=Shewanella youngdeokensis TaxID=2999068 RepID=A0ABZ0JXG5_9GAMM|nr:hypothetical protein RGE70_14675 [Shewanella sp. DAU334]
MLTTLLVGMTLTGGFAWDNIGTKQVLICDLGQLEHCLRQLPLSARPLLPTTETIRTSLGRRAAMALPTPHEDVAGVIVTDLTQLPSERSVNWGVGDFSLALFRKADMTYWHELGHFQAIETAKALDITISSSFQHEWLADLYLIWRSAKETNSLALAWQQYHRRNIDVMSSIDFLSHWSVPIMSQVLALYSAEELVDFTNFDAFLIDSWPQITVPTSGELAEFSSLIQRTFGAGTVQPLPGYMYWRKPALGQYLKPTLSELMGRRSANQWLSSQYMDGRITSTLQRF